MPEPMTPSSILVHAALAFFGAIVHASKAHRLGISKSLSDFITLTIMSSFSGVMFALIGFQFFGDQMYLTMAMAGTGGFLGVEGMTVVIDKLRELLIRK